MPTTDELKSSKQSNDLVARLRHLEKYEWNSCSEDYGAQMTIAMGREVLAEIERLTRAKADWEECVALRDAEIERLTRERDEWKNGHTMTDLRLTQRIEECERLRAALGAVYPYLPDSTSAERARSQIVSEALRGADETSPVTSMDYGGGPFDKGGNEGPNETDSGT